MCKRPKVGTVTAPTTAGARRWLQRQCHRPAWLTAQWATAAAALGERRHQLRRAQAQKVVTHLPCAQCAKRLINLGNESVYYSDYRIRTARAFEVGGMSGQIVLKRARRHRHRYELREDELFSAAALSQGAWSRGSRAETDEPYLARRNGHRFGSWIDLKDMEEFLRGGRPPGAPRSRYRVRLRSTTATSRRQSGGSG